MSDAVDWSTIMAAIHTWAVAGTGIAATSAVWDFFDPPATRPYLSMNISDVAGLGHDWVTYGDNPLVFEDVPVTPNSLTNRFDSLAHGLKTGDGPVEFQTVGTLPTPLALSTPYWVRRVDDDHLRVSETFEDAMGGTFITITDDGSGDDVFVVATPDSERQGQELTATAEGLREMTLSLQYFGAEKSGIDPVKALTNLIASIPLHLYDLDQAGVGISDVGSTSNQGAVKSIPGRRGSILEPRATAEISFYVSSSLTAFQTYIQTIDIAVKMKRDDDVTLTETDLEIRR